MKRNRRRAASGSGVTWRVLRAVRALALLGVAGFAAFHALAFARAHPYFSVREIDVRARGTLDAKTILAWSGLATGMSVWDVDEHRAEERLLAHPRIRAALAVRELPGRVEIFVEERTPVAALFGAPVRMIASDGIVFPLEDGESHDDLPYVTGFKEVDATSGAATARLRDAVGLLADWRTHPEWPAVSEIRPDADELLVFVAGSPLAVRFPTPTDAEDFTRLGTVLDLWKGREHGLASIDLSMSGEAVLKLRPVKSVKSVKAVKIVKTVRRVDKPAAKPPAPRGVVPVVDPGRRDGSVPITRGSST